MRGPQWHYEKTEDQGGEVICSKSPSERRGYWDVLSGLCDGQHMLALGCLEKEGM